jgi:hypothetical protein
LAFELDLTSTKPQSTQLPLRKKKLSKTLRKMIMRSRKKEEIGTGPWLVEGIGIWQWPCVVVTSEAWSGVVMEAAGKQGNADG